METRQGITSTILHAFQAERSIYGAYHLLKGKKSTQTIQDGSLFSVHSYFGLFPNMNRSHIEEDAERLVIQNDAIWQEDNRIVLTKQGLIKLERFHEKRPYLLDLEGWRYETYTEIVWLRLCLYLQSLTHVIGKPHPFYPITHRPATQHWVKKNMPRHRVDRKKYLDRLYDELLCFLSTCSEVQAMIFVQQLSGKSKVGYTIQQIADQMDIGAVEVYLYHIATLHRLFTTVEANRDLYPYLTMFVADLKQEFTLTESARYTLRLLESGNTLKEIRFKRQLKQNTIEDHIVEIALQHPRFSIRSYVSEKTEKIIHTSADTLQTSRLREIKEKLPPEVSYFMIRLAMARRKVDHET